MFLSETARQVAKNTYSGKATKPLDRLTPNLAHMFRFIWEWIYANQLNLNTQVGISGRFRGEQIQKSWEAVKRLDRLAQNLVQVCGFVWEWT